VNFPPVRKIARSESFRAVAILLGILNLLSPLYLGKQNLARERSGLGEVYRYNNVLPRAAIYHHAELVPGEDGALQSSPTRRSISSKASY
jgi:hypothetical protein